MRKTLPSPAPSPATRRAARRPGRRPGLTVGIGIAAGAALVIAVPLAASAHVEASVSSTSAGSQTLVTFTVPHGCDGSPTTRIAIDIPTAIDAVTPTVNPGWTARKVISGSGDDARTSRVIYAAKTPLPDGYRDTLSLSLTVPVHAAGDTLAFPTLQTCETGSTNWDQKTPADGDEPEHPAPAFTVTALDPRNVGDDVSLTPTQEKSLESATATPTASALGTTAVEGDTDVVARVLGVLGLAVGTAGVVAALVSRRRADR